MAANISYNRKVERRMDIIRAKLEKEEYNDGDPITWSDILEYILKEAEMWAIPKESKKSKGSKKVESKEKFHTED